MLVEYPRDGVYSLGFLTAEGPEPVASLAGGEVRNVFLPNSPNPTAGRLVVVPADQVHEVDISVGRGFRLLVTTGIAEEQSEVAALRDGNETGGSGPPAVAASGLVPEAIYMYAESHRVGWRTLPQLSHSMRPIASMAFASRSHRVQ
ncbi:hypothetical protein BRC83_05815 [Halobacteriales archaeon QS_1_68_17]|nr:MAG: hypothetical protein BRC83_05815 [Halobacteriales archaeon QS_1_68_17]